MKPSFLSQNATGLCLGIDPIFQKFAAVNSFLKSEKERLGDVVKLTERAVFALLDACQESGVIGSLKFQSAYFEALGPKGFGLMFELCKSAHSRNLNVLLDAKRGDISTTMAAYGSCFLEKSYIDALTVTPYMGTEVIEPLVPWLQQGKMIYVVLSSSNPSGFDFQSQRLEDGRSVAEYLFDVITDKFSEHQSSIGFVIGATIVDKLSGAFQDKLACANLLMPGFGAQGADMNEDLRRLIRKSQKDIVIPVSRGFSLFGMEKHEASLQHLSSWEDYTKLAVHEMTKMSNLIG